MSPTAATRLVAEPRPDPAAEPRERRAPTRPGRLTASRLRMQGWAVVVAFQGLDALAIAAMTFWVALHRPEPVWAFTAAASAAIPGLHLFKTYDFSPREGFALHLSRVLAGMVVAWGVAFLALAPLTEPHPLGLALLAWGPWALLFMLALHGLWWINIRRWRRSGRLTPNIVVVGATAAADRLIEALVRSREAHVLGIFDDRLGRAPGDVRGVRVLGDTKALLGHRIMPYVDRIVITVPPRARERVRQLIERLRVLPNEITLLLEGEDTAGEEAVFARIANVPLATISGPPNDAWRAFSKRLQDLVVGSLALVIAAPVMALIALAIRLDSPGPVLFRQRRHGFNNEEITVWKFRSMRHERADASASKQVTVDDERVTRIGRFIRSTSLDELPQLVNVLKGEMSLVGPRPHAVGMKTGDVESARLVAEYAHRHRMKPGMTGWAAIHGSRGPVDTAQSVRRRVALDVEYIERQSVWLDLYIMAMTIPCLVGDRAAVR